MLIASHASGRLDLKDHTGCFCGSAQGWGFYAVFPIPPKRTLLAVCRDARIAPKRYKGDMIFAGWDAASAIYSNRRRPRPSPNTE